MLINANCSECLTKRWLAKCPEADTPKAAEYARRVREIVSVKDTSSPEKDYELQQLRASLFGPDTDYAPIKSHFNVLLMAMEPGMYEAAMAAPDPLKRAVQYAMTGNFIDFAAMESVDEDTLRKLISEADRIPISDDTLARFRQAVLSARRLAYLLDNCGEIVMDRVLMRVIKALNPAVALTAVVKGAPVVNDATREDAAEARLSDIAHVIDTGVGIAGIPENRVSGECRAAMQSADVLISKGQANYETLCGCGLNLFYIFMCKCQLIMDRFHVPQFSGIITHEAV